MLPTFTMRPERRAAMPGKTAWISASAPTRLVSSMRRTSSSGVSASGPNRLVPALLIRTSMRPAAAITASTPSRMEAGSVTSSRTASRPSAFRASTDSARRALAKQRSPRRRSSRARPRPIPEEQPVTRTTCDMGGSLREPPARARLAGSVGSLSLLPDAGPGTLPGMQRTRSVAMIVYPGANAIDVHGPLEVFACAARLLAGDRPAASPAYRLEVAARRSGVFASQSGVELVATRALSELRGRLDTLMVSGGRGAFEARRDRELTAWLRRAAARSRRVASVCTGSFVLAETGLLDGRRATTHWNSCALLAREYPKLLVD